MDIVGINGKFQFFKDLFCVADNLQFSVFQLLNLALRELAAG
jgi:hypothetical protein